jgi:cob(I)alamin adenosyltransferase
MLRHGRRRYLSTAVHRRSGAPAGGLRLDPAGRRPEAGYRLPMAVHLTRIYTRTGDDGTTALGDFSRVRKTDVRLAAYADTDETNAAIGVAVTVGGLAQAVLAPLRQIQNDLFDVGADLCTPITPDLRYPPLRVTAEYVTRLEGWCDEFNSGLATLDSFILPGGTPGAAYLHVARTVTRRAERSVWALLDTDAERTNPLTATYLNRLSDLLFILGRVANPGGDVLWRPGGPAVAPGTGGGD